MEKKLGKTVHRGILSKYDYLFRKEIIKEAKQITDRLGITDGELRNKVLYEIELLVTRVKSLSEIVYDKDKKE